MSTELKQEFLPPLATLWCGIEGGNNSNAPNQNSL